MLQIARCTQLGILGLLTVVATGCGNSSAESPAPDMNRVSQVRGEFGQASGGSGPAEVAFEPIGWATIRGTITLKGTPPTRLPYAVTQDDEVCAPGGTAPLQEVVVVGDDGGLANVALFLANSLSPESGLIHESAMPGNAEPVVFDQHNCVFDNHVMGMQTSQPLLLTNNDSTGHNAKGSPSANVAFNKNLPENGGQAEIRFMAQERKPFPIQCSIHPWMNAYILVRDNSYFDVTDTTGTFELTNLPAGIELDLRLWQEKVNFNLSEVEINGSARQLGRGAKIIQPALEPGSVLEWNIVIDASQLQ